MSHDDAVLVQCPECGKELEGWRRLAGHRGGAHFRSVLRGRAHPNWRSRAEKRAAIRHGTNAGYQAHRALGERACAACKATHSRYVGGGAAR